MGSIGEHLVLSADPGFNFPCMGNTGNWESAGSIAVRESLCLGSIDGVMDILGSMDARDIAGTLREAGFDISDGIAEKGRDALLASVQEDLERAAEMRVDGYGLEYAPKSFAAKEIDEVVMAFSPQDYVGDYLAAQSIQSVLSAKTVKVDLLGVASPGERGSLLFVAGQAMDKDLQGFGYEGIAGKYEVPLSMSDVVELHRDAACLIAEESARKAITSWANGERVGEISELVPDSVQRLMHGSLSVAAVISVVNSIESGMVGRHAGDMGAHHYERLLKEQGYDLNAPTVDQQADQLGLVVITPDTRRGQYVGPVVGIDHRATIIKFAREKAVELPFDALEKDHSKPKLGDTVRMKFNAGILTVNVKESERSIRDMGR